MRLARHFVAPQAADPHGHGVDRSRTAGPRLGPHSFQRDGDVVPHSPSVTVSAAGEQVVSGLTGLTLLNSTASEFHGFPRDRYTTLPETTDRVLATAVDARWRHLRQRRTPTGPSPGRACGRRW